MVITKNKLRDLVTIKQFFINIKRVLSHIVEFSFCPGQFFLSDYYYNTIILKTE
jgi:hypothetical protein